MDENVSPFYFVQSIPAALFGWLVASICCTLPFSVYSAASQVVDNGAYVPPKFQVIVNNSVSNFGFLTIASFSTAFCAFLFFGLPYVLSWRPEKMLREPLLAAAVPILFADIMVELLLPREINSFLFKGFGRALIIWGVAFATVDAGVAMWVYLRRVCRVVSRS